jgi:hypothetical protein
MGATLLSQAQSLHSGSTATAGTGDQYKFLFGGTWVKGDTYSLVFTDQSTGVQTRVGAGNFSGITPLYCFTYSNKVLVTGGSTVYTSAIGLPTVFNNPSATGNGYITMSNFSGAAENLVAIAPYQGRLAFFTRRTCQIWTVSSLLSGWSLVQMLQNIGTTAPLSVQPLGDLDVLFLSDTGIRSLRVHDSSLNAYINDIGSPIDQFIQNSGVTTAACAVVDPQTGRYMCYNNGTIYVLSYYPSSKIIAWSTYLPTYWNGTAQVTFVPQKFFVYQGQVYCLATTGGNTVIFQFGGSTGVVYDTCTMTVQIPFFDAKSPGTMKQSIGFDVFGYGTFDVATSFNYEPLTTSYSPVFSGVLINQGTTEQGSIGLSGTGTHLSIQAKCSDAAQSTLASLIWHYNKANEH